MANRRKGEGLTPQSAAFLARSALHRRPHGSSHIFPGVEGDRADRAGGWVGAARNLLGVVVVGAAFYFIWQRRETFVANLDVSAGGLTLMLALTAGGWVANTGQSYALYRAEALPLSFAKNFILAAATSFGNFLPLRFGTLVRARYLKREYGLRYARSGSVFVIRGAIQAAVSGIVGSLALLGLGLSGGRVSWVLALLLPVLAALATFALIRPLPALPLAGARVQRIWDDFRIGLGSVREQPALAFEVAAWTLGHNLLLGGRFWLGLTAFHVEISPLAVLLMCMTTSLTSPWAITPGNLGAREAVMGYVTLTTGFAFGDGMFAGALDRAVQLGLVATLGAASFCYIWFRATARRS